MELLTPLLVIIGFGAVLYFLKFQKPTNETDQEKNQLIEENVTLKAHLEQRTQEGGHMAKEIEMERDLRNQLEGKGKELSKRYMLLEAELASIRKEREELQNRVTRTEAERDRRDTEFQDRIAKLEAAELSLKQERIRVIREDEDRLKQQEEARDRLWADHENSVIATLTDLCKKPEFAFTAYNNTNLPEGFDGSLKPDFMVEFLGQYVVFDAKVSKAKSLQTYITKQVADTVEKVKNDDRIYKTIFLIVPANALSELKNHHYPVEGYSVFIISQEALPAILTSLKRITLYEFAEQMDPQQRENIVQLIAELDFHINLRNAADIILSKMGTDLLQKTQRVDPALAAEVAVKKQPMNAKASVSVSDIKRLVTRLSTQEQEIEQLVSPHAPVASADLDAVRASLIETAVEAAKHKILASDEA